MANGKLNLGKQSGGVLSLTFPDGATNTEVVLPESGNVVSVDGAVTDNAVARYDGTTGKLQDSGVTIDDNNTVTLPGSVGNIGLNTGGGGNSITFSRNGYNYITANGGTGSSIHFGTGHSGQYYENTKMLLDPSGNLLLTSGTGALGYGTGAGGTVTQLTSKSTAVILNKPCGTIIMNNTALAAGASAVFSLNNNSLEANDMLHIETNINSIAYQVKVYRTVAGLASIQVTNVSAGSLSDALVIKFAIIKGANS